ncbi:F0F1 ATP synthase assembly protein I [Marinomonas sp. 42_23_T18]|jgi:ATP synthase protein I|nr:F0F1 ATP synthase assembly protein I [Marinomonas sp. 42_23_T18]
MTNSKPLSSKELMKAKKTEVFLFVFFQFLAACVITIVIYIANSELSAYSFFLGAIASVIPSAYMAIRVFGGKKVRPAQEIAKSFYKGEAGKLIITALMMSLIFSLVKPLAAGFFFAGFGITVLSHWLSPFVLRH